MVILTVTPQSCLSMRITTLVVLLRYVAMQRAQLVLVKTQQQQVIRSVVTLSC